MSNGIRVRWGKKEKLLTSQISDVESLFFTSLMCFEYFFLCFVSDQTERRTHQASSVAFDESRRNYSSHPNSVKWLQIKAFQTLFFPFALSRRCETDNAVRIEPRQG